MEKDNTQAKELFEKDLLEIKSYFSENKSKILDVLDDMFRMLKQEELIDEVGDWVLSDVIIMGDFTRFVDILSVANVCGADVHDIVEEYIDWLLSTTKDFSYASFIASSTVTDDKLDVRQVLIDETFKPLFTLIIQMCKTRRNEDLFIKLSDFCNFINNYANFSNDEIKADEDDEVFWAPPKANTQTATFKSGFNRRVYELCLNAFIKRASYTELEEYFDYIYSRRSPYNLSKYTVNVGESYYNEILSHIEDAKRSKITLQEIKKSREPFMMLKEKYPNKSNIRLLSFMIKNKALEKAARSEIKAIKRAKSPQHMSYNEWYDLVYGFDF